MIPLRSEILVEAISIASSSLQQIRYISLALSLKCLHFRSSRPELFFRKGVLEKFTKFTGVSCEFCKILKNTFFRRTRQRLFLAFAPIEVTYTNTVHNKLAAEAWICLVSFYSGVKDFIFTCIFLRIITFFIKI